MKSFFWMCKRGCGREVLRDEMLGEVCCWNVGKSEVLMVTSGASGWRFKFKEFNRRFSYKTLKNF
jgi:hypothetical protein